jgi:hypothetical protein
MYFPKLNIYTFGRHCLYFRDAFTFQTECFLLLIVSILYFPGEDVFFWKNDLDFMVVYVLLKLEL